MRMVILLLVLAILGVIAARQLAGPGDTSETSAIADTSTPDVPQQPRELDDFERDMGRLMEESAAARRQRIDEEK